MITELGAAVLHLEAVLEIHRRQRVITCNPGCWCWVAERVINAHAQANNSLQATGLRPDEPGASSDTPPGA